MTHKDVLWIIRYLCIIQFIVVIAIVFKDGITRTDQMIIAGSIVFGLLFDGFSHISIQLGLFQRQRKIFDREFDDIVKDIKKDQSE